MLKAMSTYALVRERLHPGLLESLVRAGAEAIEIFAFRGHFDYGNRRQHVLEIANWFKATGMALHSVHSPMYSSYEWAGRGMEPINIVGLERKDRIEAMDEIKRAIEIAEHVPFRFLVQHVGIGGESYDEKKFDAAMSSIEHLRAFAKPLGVRLLLENIPNELSTMDRLLELLRVAHFDDVGICFDVGHAHMMSNVESAFEIAKSHIWSTHVHDNQGQNDSHLWPGEGNIDWKQAMELLRNAPNTPPLMLEIEGEHKNMQQIAQGMGEAYRKLDGA
jgi:sugar phosphate isomerase/epimerase